MRLISSTRALIAISLVGLMMSFATIATGQPSESPTEEEISAPLTGLKADTLNDASKEPAGSLDAKTGAELPAKEVEQTAASNPTKASPVTSAKEVYDALKAGKWLVAFGGILMFLVWGIRAVLDRFNFSWAKGELAGNIIAFGTAFGLAIGTALVAGQGLSLGLLMAAAGAAWAAKGTWSHVQAAKEARTKV